MNKYLKYAIYAIIGILLIVIIVQYFNNKSLRKTNQIQSVELLTANDSAKMYKTKTGEMYFEINAAVVERNALRSSLINAGFEIKDLRQKDIEWRNVTSVLKAKLEASGSAVITLHDTVYIDSTGVKIPAKDFAWSNNHLSLNGLIKAKTAEIDYEYQIGLNAFTETKGKNTKITLFTDDPKATISTGYQINVINKTPFYKKWYVWAGIGLAGGYFISK